MTVRADATSELLAAIGRRFGDRVVLWRGWDPQGSDVDLLATDDDVGSELAGMLWRTGLRPIPGDPGHVVWEGGGMPIDVLRASSWPRPYPPLASVLGRLAPSGAGPPIASREDRLLIFAAEAVAGRPAAKVAARVRQLLAAPGVAERLKALAAEEGREALATLVVRPMELQAAARRGRLPYGRAIRLAARCPAARAALSERLVGRVLRMAGGRAVVAGAVYRPGATRAPLLVTVSGMDGAGKSTLAEAIERRLEASGMPAEVAWARLGSEGEILNRVALPVKRLLRRRGTTADPIAAGGPATDRVQDPRETSGRRRPLSWAWIVLVAAINARSYRRAASGRRRGFAIVCDRWADDALVDLELRYGEHRLAREILRRLPPPPDLAVLLEIDAATAAARKPGDQAEHVLRAMELLYAREARDGRAVVVDARTDQDHVESRVAALLDATLAREQ